MVKKPGLSGKVDRLVACALFAFAIFLLPFNLKAQTDTSRLRVSLLTCGPGNEFIGASFGHNAIRITDSATGVDEAYNYGTFDFNEHDFEWRFAQGTLVYIIAKTTFQGFVQEYAYSGRSVLEQELSLDAAQKVRLRALLEENLLPENRGYIYSSVYDNCATRVRDVVRNAVGDNLKYGTALPGNQKLTFRQVWNAHLTGQVWERFGINILTGTNVDKVMTNEQAMFLPEYLANGFDGGVIDGRPLVASRRQLLPQLVAIRKDGTIDPPFWVMLGIAALIIGCQLVPGMQRTGMVLGRTLLFITGVLGCLMIVMWAATDHKICENNLNLLWALPTNLIAAFRRRNISRYIVVAIVLIFLSLCLHLLRIQILPLMNLWPILLALLMTYGMIYRRSKMALPTYGKTNTLQD